MLRVRWLGTVPYSDALALQRGLFSHSRENHLLLLEHPHVYTLGARARPEHVLFDPTSVGAELLRVDRGGDVTYHGPGQLVGYPIVSVPMAPGAIPAHVAAVEEVVLAALGDLGLGHASRLDGYPGVWVGAGGPYPRKICAVGVRVSRGRSMHGFALNVDPDLSMFEHIVPCGLTNKGVTSLSREGLDLPIEAVVDVIARRAADRWGQDGAERQDVSPRLGSPRPAPPCTSRGGSPAPSGRSSARPVPRGERRATRLAAAGVDLSAAIPVRRPKPEWLRVKADMGTAYRALRRTMRSLDLVTVCEEAGCPNIYECWGEGTATFMINGDRCTRACGFCLVDTRRPFPLDADEPGRVAEAVSRMGLEHAVVTAVARDDLRDGGAGAFAETVAAIRERCPGTAVELLIPDCKGDSESLCSIFESGPDVLNHNVETVARLQRAVRPSASYARSLAVLARAKEAGLRTKSGLIVGLGETFEEVQGALADMRGVGVDIVTVGQYLRPSASHLPVARWWSPAEFDSLRSAAEGLGFLHVEASPLTRSSYHARAAAAAGDRSAAVPVAAPSAR